MQPNRIEIWDGDPFSIELMMSNFAHLIHGTSVPNGFDLLQALR